MSYTKLLSIVCWISLPLYLSSCTSSVDTTNANSNSAIVSTNTNTSTTTSSSDTRVAPDESEVTVVEENGVRTETRVFKNKNSRVEKIVVTTRDGKRTARVYSRSGEVRDVPENKVEAALRDTGDAVASAAGFVWEKGKDAASETADKAEDVADKTVEGAKTVGEKTADGAKKVGEKTAEGAKKAGKAIKDAVD
jgi:hypothetical protein